MRPRYAEIAICGAMIGLAAYVAYIVWSVFFYA